MTTGEYLSPDFLTWPIKPEDFDLWNSGQSEDRSYALWSHSQSLLCDAPTREHRADSIANLKRAIYQRVTALNDLYGFKEIPGLQQSRQVLEVMAGLGLVRPILLRSIIDLRNQIEHEDQMPPDESRCKEWVEFVWYFLRST
ncbi:MAG TPA: hypothetical protein VFR31_14320, partial [Thermoanaerobaculia bacterium]|nr:hypothetical protein [Thermoanaerobaculia bacterium]